MKMVISIRPHWESSREQSATERESDGRMDGCGERNREKRFRMGELVQSFAFVCLIRTYGESIIMLSCRMWMMRAMIHQCGCMCALRGPFVPRIKKTNKSLHLRSTWTEVMDIGKFGNVIIIDWQESRRMDGLWNTFVCEKVKIVSRFMLSFVRIVQVSPSRFASFSPLQRNSQIAGNEHALSNGQCECVRNWRIARSLARR